MVVTAKTADGKEIGKEERHYHPQATNCRDTKEKYGRSGKSQISVTQVSSRIRPKKKQLSLSFLREYGQRT